MIKNQALYWFKNNITSNYGGISDDINNKNYNNNGNISNIGNTCFSCTIYSGMVYQLYYTLYNYSINAAANKDSIAKELFNNAIWIFTSDHGFHSGQFGMGFEKLHQISTVLRPKKLYYFLHLEHINLCVYHLQLIPVIYHHILLDQPLIHLKVVLDND